MRNPVRLALAFTALVGGLACDGAAAKREEKLVFHFDGKLRSTPQHDIISTDPPLEGDDASTKITARRTLDVWQTGYTSYWQHQNDPYYGPQEIAGESYFEFPIQSPYFLQRSDEQILPDGGPLKLTVEASHRRVPPSGGPLWVRARIAAPGLSAVRGAGLNLVILVDVSAAPDPSIEVLLKSAAHALASQLLPVDQIALVAFADRSQVLISSRPAADVGEVLDAIDAIEVGGPKSRAESNLGAGLYAAYEEASAGAGRVPRSHVVLLSDGRFQGGGWRAFDLVRRQQAHGNIRLSTVAVGADVQPAPLAAMAQSGQGRFTLVDKSEDVEGALGREMQAILNPYARNLRLRLAADGAEVLAVHGEGLHALSQDSKDIVLADLAAGERRSIFLQVKIADARDGAAEDLKFLFSYEQETPVRRTTQEQTIGVDVGRDFDPADPGVEIHARVAAGLDLIRRALAGDYPQSTPLITSFVERELPELETSARSAGDSELALRGAQLEEFARRYGNLARAGTIGSGSDWARLKSDFYRAYR